MYLAINTLSEKRLYRFRSVDHERLERSSRIFTHNDLYFASPTQLNDPWESKPHIVVGDLSDPGYRAKYVEFVAQMMLDDEPQNDPEDVRKWLESPRAASSASMAADMTTLRAP